MRFTIAEKLAFAATGGQGFDTARPVVVFLHGAGMFHVVWALQARHLAHHGCSVLALDLPGHGDSEGPAMDNIAAMAGWVTEMLRKLNVVQAILVGHSMGALIALEVASQNPTLIQAIALLGAAATMPVHPDLLTAAKTNPAKAVALIVEWGHGSRGHMGGAPTPGLWLAGGAARILHAARPGVLATDLSACAAYRHGAEAAAMITCPVHVICGAADKMTPPKAGIALSQILQKGSVEVLPEVGHMMMTEDPVATTAAIKRGIHDEE
ncbi:MAG: alpha/beta hydrolase [Alphaproteobacteria bacterium]